jgi:glyoxylase-like metal-dependent hydrolase (beta-lactamase superfamily II)
MSDGLYEVAIVRYGTRSTTRSEVYLNYAMYGEPDAPIGMDYFFWVVRNESTTIVVDTGFSQTGGANRKRTMLVDPRDAFAALGIDPADAPTVIVTHAHYDHIGNLAHFAKSPVVVNRAEVEFWSTAASRQLLFRHSVEREELAELGRVVDSGRAQLFDDRVEVADGVEVIRVGGHTPGQSIVQVRTAAGPVVLASDALHYYEEGAKAMPFTSVANLEAMYNGFECLDTMVTSGEAAHVVTGHDPSTLERYAPAAGAAADGPLGDGMAVIGRTAP